VNYLSIDFETYCDLDINRVGSYKYIAHPSFEVLMMGYSINGAPATLWLPTKGIWTHDIADVLSKPFKVIAFNAEFEIGIIDKCYRQFGLNMPIPAKMFIDVQAVAKTYGYPNNLDDLCGALGVPGKQEDGKALVKKFSTPRKPSKNNPHTRWALHMDLEGWSRFKSYCVQDVDSMNNCLRKLPAPELSDLEKLIWLHVLEQNRRGWPVHKVDIISVLQVMKAYKERINTEIDKLTGGRITKVTQRQRIQNELHALGLKIPNLQGGTIEEWLERTDLSEYARRLLEIRYDTNHTSTGKYERMLEMMMDDGRIRGLMKYFAQSTGRFGSYGLQIHNLPRAQFPEPERVIGLFSTRHLDSVMVLYPNVMETATKLVRPMFCATNNKEVSKRIAAADFSSIENRILHWYAHDTDTLNDFENGVDQYRKFAARKFNIDYLEVTPDQRQYAKPSILGLGFGGARGALLRSAKNHGVDMSPEEADENVSFYRKVMYPKIPKMWYKLFDLALATVLSGETTRYETPNVSLEFSLVKVNGIIYFRVKLPSGRYMWYPHPHIGKGKFDSSIINFKGIDSNTKRWSWQELWYGTLVENIVQATARELIAFGMLCAEKGGYYIIGSVHDEAISEMDIEKLIDVNGKLDKYHKVKVSANELCELLCIKQGWAKGLPLAAEGYVAVRLRKG